MQTQEENINDIYGGTQNHQEHTQGMKEDFLLNVEGSEAGDPMQCSSLGSDSCTWDDERAAHDQLMQDEQMLKKFGGGGRHETET